jgi:hypothetical protein
MRSSLPAGASEFARHAVHADMLSASAYSFTGHSTHGPPGGPEKPRLHTQSLRASLPAGASECAAHSAQLAVLSASAYVFTGQSVHAEDP